MSRILRAIALASGLALTMVGFTVAPSSAAIHEIIGALCRAGGEEVAPPGQVDPTKKSFLRALRASGVIVSIDDSAGDGNDTEITFDLSKPNSKYVSGGDLTIPDFFGLGEDLILSPLPIPNGDFAAHANCRNLNP